MRPRTSTRSRAPTAPPSRCCRQLQERTIAIAERRCSPLHAMAPRREAHAIEVGALADALGVAIGVDIFVPEPEGCAAAGGRATLSQGVDQRRLFARAVRVGARQQVPKLRVDRSRGKGHLVITCTRVAGTSGITTPLGRQRLWPLASAAAATAFAARGGIRVHALYEQVRERRRRLIVEHRRECVHVDVVLS